MPGPKIGPPPAAESSSAPHAITAVVYGDARFPSSPTSVTENGIVTTFTYNADGSVATETRAGKTATYAYDGTGNLTGATVA